LTPKTTSGSFTMKTNLCSQDGRSDLRAKTQATDGYHDHKGQEEALDVNEEAKSRMS